VKSVSTYFYRSGQVESVHKIKVLVKNIDNKTIFTTGNENDLIYPRSSVKIFQAIPFIESNAVDNFKLSSKIIALSCSSHKGEEFHIKELLNWLKKIRLNKNNLKCGCHNPLNFKASEKLQRSRKKINELHNNCSGKHLAMLSSCLMNNYSIKDYLNFNHPHQIKIREIFEKFSETKFKKINFGIDGCSAPQYSFKLENISKLLINLIKSYKNNYDNSNEIKLLINSIIRNPEYIGGSDSLDTTIMKICKKRIFCKSGAEGVFLFVDLARDIVGIIKVEDGNERAIPSVIFKLLKKLSIINSKEQSEFEKVYNFKLFNHANIEVGSIKTAI